MHLRRGPATAILCAVALAITVQPIHADTVVKRNGQKLVGTIVEQDASKVVIKTKFGVMTIPREDVLEVSEGATPAQQFKERWGDVDRDDPIALWELYEWCKDMKLSRDGRTVCERIIAVDGDHELARRALGFTLVDGQWLSKREVAAAERQRKMAERAAAKKERSPKGGGKRTDPFAELGDVDGDVAPFIDVISDNDGKDGEVATSLEDFFGQRFSVATSAHFSIRAQLPKDDVIKHLELAERIFVKNNKLFGRKPGDLLWGEPYQIFHVKQKGTFIDLVDWIDDSVSEMDAETKKFFKDGGGMNLSSVPLSAQYERSVPLERAMAHWIGQNWIYYFSRGASRPWLGEGFAMHTAISEFGTNELYCSTNTKYANNVEIADKNSDAAYQLVCFDIIDGALEQTYPYVEITQKTLNQLDFADLAKSWSLVDFFMHEHLDDFKKYIAALSRHQVEEDALKAALGWTGEELDEKWKEYVLSNYDRSGS